jgi:ankyrin repeat protein
MNTLLKVAIANGDLLKIKRYFKQYSISAAVSDETAKPLLFFAIDYNQYQLLEFFLSSKDVQKIQDGDGNTVLMRAVESQNITAIKLILKKKELVKIKNSNGKTPLLLASQLGSLEIMELLFEAGADLNECDDLEYTPLH